MITRNPIAKRRKLTPLETRERVWSFWHHSNTSVVSAIPSRPAKLRKTDKPKIQAELNYISLIL